MKINNHDLWLSVNTTPSRSLEADLLETLDRLHQKAVSRVQQHYHKKVMAVWHEAIGFQQSVVDCHPYQEFEAWNVKPHDPVCKWIEQQHEKMMAMIMTMEGLRDLRKEKIRQYCASKGNDKGESCDRDTQDVESEPCRTPHTTLI